MPSWKSRARDAVRRRRRSGSRWVRVVDAARELGSAGGRARLWTRLFHGHALHQITEYTELDRYPHLFDMAARLRPDAERILSFGCSTGEELHAIRDRFPAAFITGVEINPRSRKKARERLAADARVEVMPSSDGQAPFDIIFALAVLQFQPHRIEDEGVEDLNPIYPFMRFERTVTKLVELLTEGGLLCVMHTHYRVENCGIAAKLIPLDQSAALGGPLFGPDGKRFAQLPLAQSMFIKRPD